MYLLPNKSPLTIIILLVIAFGLSFYIVWTFPWLRNSLLRRLAGLFFVVACLCLFGDYVWPLRTPSSSGVIQPPMGATWSHLEIKVPIGMTLHPPRDQIALVFKSSPLITNKIRGRIRNDLSNFRDYLVALGIPVPIELPPIGTRERSNEEPSGTGSVTPPGAQPYEGRLIFDDVSIRDPMQATYLYGDFAIRTFTHAPDSPFIKSFEFEGTSIPPAILLQIGKSTVLSGWLATYLSSSFWNRPPVRLARGFMVAALWDIRDKYGQDFTDGMIGCTFRAMMDHPAEANQGVMRYFIDNLKRGEFVKDNDNGNRWPEIEEILGKYGVTEQFFQ